MLLYKSKATVNVKDQHTSHFHEYRLRFAKFTHSENAYDYVKIKKLYTLIRNIQVCV